MYLDVQQGRRKEVCLEELVLENGDGDAELVVMFSAPTVNA